MTRNKSTKSEIFPVTSSTKLNAHTHKGTHTHRGTHIQEHTHTGTHIQEHTHTQEHPHIWTGQGGHHRGPRGAGSGALTVCQGCTTCTATHTRDCSCTPSSSSATLWGKGAVQGMGVHTYKGCTLTTSGTSLDPTLRVLLQRLGTRLAQ